MAVTGDADRVLRIAARRLRAAGIARPGQHLVELAFEHGLQEFANPIAKASLDRIEPVVEKVLRRLDFRLRKAGCRAIACHGVISAGISVPELLVGPSWRLRRFQFPTTPATAPHLRLRMFSWRQRPREPNKVTLNCRSGCIATRRRSDANAALEARLPPSQARRPSWSWKSGIATRRPATRCRR